MPKYWYTIHSHPHKEDLLWQQALSRGVEVFYPRIRVYPVNPRSRKIVPYFPGYLFVYSNLEEIGLSFFQWMPYATGLVSFGGEPAVVPENLIHALKQRMVQIEENGGELFDSLRPGDLVTISAGPFAGYEAIFDLRLPGSERVRVLLQMLNRRLLPVEIDAGQVEKKRKPKSG